MMPDAGFNPAFGDDAAWQVHEQTMSTRLKMMNHIAV
jgi:hypothetical protein